MSEEYDHQDGTSNAMAAFSTSIESSISEYNEGQEIAASEEGVEEESHDLSSIDGMKAAIREDEDDGDDSEVPEEGGEDDTEEEEEVSEETAPSESPEQTFKDKEISFVSGDTTHGIPNNAIVEITVDGKTQKMYLQEALNRASGDVSVENRITEVSKLKDAQRASQQELVRERKVYEKQLADRDAMQTKLLEQFASGNWEDAVIYAAHESGKDPGEVIKEFMESVSGQVSHLQALPVADRQRWLDNMQFKSEKYAFAQEQAQMTSQEETRVANAESDRVSALIDQQREEQEVTQEELDGMTARMTEANYTFKATTSEGMVTEIMECVKMDKMRYAASLVDADESNPENHISTDDALLTTLYQFATKQGNLKSTGAFEEFIRGYKKEVHQKEDNRIAENLSRKERKSSTSQRASEAPEEEAEDFMTLSSYGRTEY